MGISLTSVDLLCRLYQAAGKASGPWVPWVRSHSIGNMSPIQEISLGCGYSLRWALFKSIIPVTNIYDITKDMINILQAVTYLQSVLQAVLYSSSCKVLENSLKQQMENPDWNIAFFCSWPQFILQNPLLTCDIWWSGSHDAFLRDASWLKCCSASFSFCQKNICYISQAISISCTVASTCICVLHLVCQV